MANQYYEGVGRRKASTARVRVMSGTGQIIVNEKSLEEYFTRMGDSQNIVAPLSTVGQDSSVDVSVLVKGGGVTGQTDAVQLGLARALIKMNPDYRSAMRKGGFLTRDSREKNARNPASSAPARHPLTPSVSGSAFTGISTAENAKNAEHKNFALSAFSAVFV